MSQTKENCTNTEDNKNNQEYIKEISPDDDNDNIPEPEISENEMKEIINFINNWDYEKYERDAEVREALLLLRTKMKQEEEEKAKKLNELRIKEKIEEKNYEKNKDNNDIKNEKEIFNEESYNNNANNMNKINTELSEKDKEILEKNWVYSTKPEYGDKIVNEKGDKEIIISNNNDNKKKKVILYFILMHNAYYYREI